MKENRQLSPVTSPEEPLTEHVPLLDIRERWAKAPELPFAYQDPENIITDNSLVRWVKDLNRAFERKLLDQELITAYDGFILREEAMEYYRKLRFLSESTAMTGLAAIATDVSQHFDPATTLIHLEYGSMEYLHRLMGGMLTGYGTMHWNPRKNNFEVSQAGQFQGTHPNDAQSWLYIDDWVLSGTQLLESISPLFGSKDKLHTYHLVMSDRGKHIYDKNGIQGKAVYKLNGDDGPELFFGNYPVFGFHKIPDVISPMYADHARDREPSWTIFPDREGHRVGKSSRLRNYY